MFATFSGKKMAKCFGQNSTIWNERPLGVPERATWFTERVLQFLGPSPCSRMGWDGVMGAATTTLFWCKNKNFWTQNGLSQMLRHLQVEALGIRISCSKGHGTPPFSTGYEPHECFWHGPCRAATTAWWNDMKSISWFHLWAIGCFLNKCQTNIRKHKLISNHHLHLALHSILVMASAMLYESEYKLRNLDPVGVVGRCHGTLVQLVGWMCTPRPGRWRELHPDRNAMELLPTSRSALPSSAFFDSLDLPHITFKLLFSANYTVFCLFKRIHITQDLLWKRG